jgi:hypothetical protein
MTISLAVACGHSDLPDAEACEHFEEGPFEPVAATPEPESAPTVDQVHVAYQVELSADAPVYVAFSADEANEYYFFADQAVAIEFLVDGAPVIPASSCSTGGCSDACGLIEARAVLSLDAGVVTVGLGPGEGTAMLLVEEGSGHDH